MLNDLTKVPDYELMYQLGPDEAWPIIANIWRSLGSYCGEVSGLFNEELDEDYNGFNIYYPMGETLEDIQYIQYVKYDPKDFGNTIEKVMYFKVLEFNYPCCQLEQYEPKES
jgi:hypothetical protein